MNMVGVFDFTEAVFWSAICVLGFSLLFQVPKRVLHYCAFIGAFGYGLKTISITLGGNLILAALLGATAVGFLGYFIARWKKMPTPIFTVPAIIPLIPGSIAFQSLVAMIRALEVGMPGGETFLFSAAFGILTASLILLSLGIGISAPILLFRRHRPVV